MDQHQQDFWVVEYPGYVNNTDKALETLGGLAEVEARFLENRPMECRFRPAVPTCKPIPGEIRSTNNFIVHISQPARSGNDMDTDAAQDANGGMEYHVLGPVTKAARFREMPDFQFHFPHDHRISKMAASVRNADFRALDQLATQSPFTRTPKSEPGELLPIPPFFTRDRTPFDYAFKQCSAVRVVEQGNIKNISNKHQKVLFVSVQYQEPVPPEAPEDLLKKAEVKNADQNKVYKKLVELFNERPISTRARLAQHFTADQILDFKKYLPLIAYHTRTGPWRACWIKFGVDPKSSPEYRMYQLMDVRMRNEKPGTVKMGMTRLLSNGQSSASISEQDTKDERAIIQMCDITDPSFQFLVNYDQIAPRDECDHREGWFKTAHINVMRLLLNHLIRVASNDGSTSATMPWEMTDEQRKQLQKEYAQRLADEIKLVEARLSNNNAAQASSGSGRRDIEKQVDKYMENLHVRQLEAALQDPDTVAGATDALLEDEGEYSFFEDD